MAQKRGSYKRIRTIDLVAAIEMLKDAKEDPTSELIHDRFFAGHPIHSIRNRLTHEFNKGVVTRERKVKPGGGIYYIYGIPDKNRPRIGLPAPDIPQPVLDDAWAKATDAMDTLVTKKPEPQKQKLMAECSVCGLMIPLKKRNGPHVVSCGCGAEFLQAVKWLYKLEKPEIPIEVWTRTNQIWNGGNINE